MKFSRTRRSHGFSEDSGMSAVCPRKCTAMGVAPSPPRVLLAVLLAGALSQAALVPNGRVYTVVPESNAVPTGRFLTTAGDSSECGKACDSTPGCLQWSFNAHTSEGHHHCFVSNSTKWEPIFNNHVTSGCLPEPVNGCPLLPPPPPSPPAPLPKLPYWTAPLPDKVKPLFGYKKLPNVSDSILYRPESTAEGMYNHAAMIAYHKGTITVTWKNAPISEDTPGQRVLFSQSSDGKSWTKAAPLFPNMSTSATAAAQFAGPFAVINGRLYASASPAIIADGDAQGAQFCLWPDGLDPRNCATPDDPGSQPSGLLQLRAVQPGGLGDVFWASQHPPPAYAAAAAANGVQQLADMDSQTRADVATLVGNGVSTGFVPPCEAGGASGTLKCEACPGGCQLYATPSSKGLGLANERTHYPVPNSTRDVILFRAHSGTLWSSVRIDGSTEGNWSRVAETNIPNDNSNLNAGVYSAGVYLVHNVAPAHIRDPLTVSLSRDGYNFDSCRVIQTCTDIAGGQSTCKARNSHNKNVGPSYPQALSVVAPAPEAMRGLYVVATNNKEDVIVSHVPWEALDR